MNTSQIETHDDVSDQVKDIMELQSLGINVSDLQKLKDAGINTVGLVLMTPGKELENIKGFSEAKVEKVVSCARKLVKNGFISGSEALSLRKHILRISSGSSALNQLLGGGFQSKSITELHGEGRTGKTQICHTLCITTQLPKQDGGAEGKAVYIDTEGCFRPERLKEIAEGWGFESDQILENVIVKRCYTHDEQMLTPLGIVALLTSDPPEPIRLIVVDSIMALFRVEYSGRGELSIRQQRLAQHLHDLQRVADEFNVAVVVTNQMSADPGAMIAACSQKPVGGNIIAHACATRILMKKGRENARICKLIDSPDQAEGDASVVLTNKGIEDN
jgi:meiotic recombination protein DMC1